MFIAMDRFKVIKEERKAFEDLWVTRQSHLDEVKGFRAFHLLRGPEREDHVLYSSHTIWASQEDFTAWTKSEQFRAAHQHAGEHKPASLPLRGPSRARPGVGLAFSACGAARSRRFRQSCPMARRRRPMSGRPKSSRVQPLAPAQVRLDEADERISPNGKLSRRQRGTLASLSRSRR
jgi:heme-degrading monooxygenase HmoA